MVVFGRVKNTHHANKSADHVVFSHEDRLIIVVKTRSATIGVCGHSLVGVFVLGFTANSVLVVGIVHNTDGVPVQCRVVTSFLRGVGVCLVRVNMVLSMFRTPCSPQFMPGIGIATPQTETRRVHAQRKQSHFRRHSSTWCCSDVFFHLHIVVACLSTL